MDRYAMISIPEAMQTGFAIPLLFFDKILVPDQEHVTHALRIIEQSSPEHYRDVAEIRLGLGYYLWPGGVPLNELDWARRPNAILGDIQQLEKRGIADRVPWSDQLRFQWGDIFILVMKQKGGEHDHRKDSRQFRSGGE